jgi:hypothetical protein
MKKTNIYGIEKNYSVIPLELVTDDNISLQAIGLAAKIVYEHKALTMHKDSDYFFDKITLAKEKYFGNSAYYELVDAGYINDFFKDGIQI